jgi:hypothetical protein
VATTKGNQTLKRAARPFFKNGEGMMPKKGWRHSDESKAKISVALKGRSFSEQALANMRMAAKPRRGIPRSAESRAKMSAAKKGRPFSEQHLAKLQMAAKLRRGIPRSEETRAKISVALTGRPGHSPSAETKARQRSGLKQHYDAKDNMTNFYVYVWRHLGIARYVGSTCVGRRWRKHKSDADRPEKSAYFQQHEHEMECEKVLEGVTWTEAHALEGQLCRQFGLLCDGTGTLFNRTYSGAQAGMSQASKGKMRVSSKARCPEQVLQNGHKAYAAGLGKATKEQLSEWGHKAAEACPDLSQRGRKAYAAGLGKATKEQLSEWSRKGNETKAMRQEQTMNTKEQSP